MSKIISYLDNQSDIRLLTDANIAQDDLRTTDLLFLLKGTAELKIDEKCYMMKADDIVVVNKYESYSLDCDKGSLVFYFSISDFLLAQALSVESVSFNCNSIENSSKNYDLIRKIIIEIIDLLLFENDKTNFLQLSKVYHLLNELSSLFLEQQSNVIEQDERIKQITRTIKERYYENITLSEMARLVHMDTAYFSRFFKKTLGVNFKDYLSKIRMQHAIHDLLESDKAVTRIAIDNGFFSVNGFNKKFKELYQQTPSDYRKQYIVEKQQPVTKSDADLKASFSEYKDTKDTDYIVKKSYIQLEIGQQEAIPIKETWSEILNIGEAELVLNSNIRQHLSILQKNIRFKYGRIWAVFTEKLLGESLHEYEIIDEILDSLLGLGLLPWLSINKIADAFKESEYPAEVWQEAIRRFCLHILNRYGRQKVANWKVEIVATAQENPDSISRYCIFYQTTYKICKELIPELPIGGATFIMTNSLELEQLLNDELAGCTFDFYSFALFPYSNRLVREKRNFQRITDPDFLRNQVKSLKELELTKPLYISEWSNTVSRSNLLNDSLYKGAFVIKSVIDIFDQVDGMGYWLGTDLAQKSPKLAGLLTGGNGLLNKNSLFKPAMNALKFFEQLRGLKLVYKDEQHLICSADGDEFFVLGHQYTHPNSLYFLKDEAHLQLTELDHFFEENAYEEELVLSNIPNGKYELRVFSCLKDHGDLFGQWAKFKFTRDLRSSDLSYLDAKNTHLQTLEEVQVTQRRLVIKKRLTTNEFYEINVKRKQ